MLQGNAIIAQSGGPSAVINSSACGVIQTWFQQEGGSTMYAGVGGVKGILAGDIIDLSAQKERVIEGLRHTPGAGLYSCRYKVSSDDQQRLVEIFKRLNIRYFFYNGGNDSMDTAHKTWEAAKAAGWEMNVIGVPKTIDNDLPFTDHCPGFGSAAKYIATSIRETGLDLQSVSTKTKVTIMEIMGRNAGWLTASSLLARRDPDDAPQLIYLPEAPFSQKSFLDDVQRVYDRLGYCYVAVSEGIRDSEGNYCFSAQGGVDAFGHVQLSGVGASLKDLIERELHITARCNTPGTMQRAAMHYASKTDLDEAYMVGCRAVEYALAGKNGVMVTLDRKSQDPYVCTCGEVGLDKVANVEKIIPKEWITPAGNDVTADFITYCRPLIMGEPVIPTKDGLPDFIKLDFSLGRL